MSRAMNCSSPSIMRSISGVIWRSMTVTWSTDSPISAISRSWFAIWRSSWALYTRRPSISFSTCL